MSRPRVCLLLAVLLPLAPPALARCDSPGRPTDCFGDPLPAGAIARFGSVRWRHPDAITCLAFSPDGVTAATGSKDGKLRFWDAATGRLLRQVPANTREPASVTFSPDGKTL